MALTPVFLQFFALESQTEELVFRLVFSYLFAVGLNLGVMGIAWAMCAEGTVRGAMFWLRMRSGAWKKFKII